MQRIYSLAYVVSIHKSDLLGELSGRFNLEVYAYVQMGNHCHILLKIIDAKLSKAMQSFGKTFTLKISLINHTSRHLLQDRFKSIIVENDDDLLRSSWYIHRNPLRAGIVERLADFPWNSYLFYAYKKNLSEWLKNKTILNQNCGENQNKAYRIKIQQYSDEKASIWEDVKHGLIFGGQEFIEDIKARFLGDEKMLNFRNITVY